jgi:hypothetical protein
MQNAAVVSVEMGGSKEKEFAGTPEQVVELG